MFLCEMKIGYHIIKAPYISKLKGMQSDTKIYPYTKS